MTKKDQTQYCRIILLNAKLNELLTNHSDIQFLMDLFESHPEWEFKKGAGINGIKVILSNYKNRCFELQRVDGTKTDISFTVCISKTSILSYIKKACRNAIRNEIVLFRDANVKFGISVCPFTNEILTKDNCHIDHFDMKFNQMVNFWINLKGVEYLYNQIEETKDNNFDTCFNKQDLIDEFIKYHNSNTHLRAVSITANLSFLK
jgi:hypothetical protein